MSSSVLCLPIYSHINCIMHGCNRAVLNTNTHSLLGTFFHRTIPSHFQLRMLLVLLTPVCSPPPHITTALDSWAFNLFHLGAISRSSEFDRLGCLLPGIRGYWCKRQLKLSVCVVLGFVGSIWLARNIIVRYLDGVSRQCRIVM